MIFLPQNPRARFKTRHRDTCARSDVQFVVSAYPTERAGGYAAILQGVFRALLGRDD